MASNAFAGVGTQFQREDDTSSGVFDPIAEVLNIGGPSMTRTTIDVTNLDSEGGYMEYIGGFRDGGEVALEMNMTLDTVLLMKADFEASGVKNYRIVWSDAGGTTADFAAFVTGIDFQTEPNSQVKANATLKITGPVDISS